jgi:hypothetical protein
LKLYLINFELVEALDPDLLDELIAFHNILLLPIDKLAKLGEVASESSLHLDLEEKDCEILFVPWLNNHFDSLLDIGSIFDYLNVAGYFFLPVNNAPLLAHDGIKNLLLEAFYELWFQCDVLYDKENVVINRVLILFGELAVKGQLQ